MFKESPAFQREKISAVLNDSSPWVNQVYLKNLGNEFHRFYLFIVSADTKSVFCGLSLPCCSYSLSQDLSFVMDELYHSDYIS